jgi:tetratricopeptide (TPR) repeat protein
VRKTARGVDDALADAARLRGEAQSAAPGDAGRWSAALSAAKRAQGLLAQGDADTVLKGRVDALMAGLEHERAASFEKARQIEIDRVLLADLESVRGNRVAHLDLKRCDAEYGAVFRNAGIDLDTTGAKEAGMWVASRTDPIELAGYLDDWALVRRGTGRSVPDWRRLVTAARGGDPDPWRDALRARFGSNDAGAVAEFHRLADDPGLLDQPAAGLLLLARQLKFGCGEGKRAAQVLRRAARRYPGDFRIHFELAQAPGAALESRPSVIYIYPNPEEAVRHLTTALGIRPESASTHEVLAVALMAHKKPDEAEAECREAIRLKPGDATALAYLGNALRWQGKFDEAERVLREAIRLNPDDAQSHSILGIVINTQGRFDEAVNEYREAIRLKPDYVGAALALAQVLQRKGDYAGALAAVRELEGHATGPFADPVYNTPEWLAQVEPLAALEGRLPAILKGEDRPKGAAERLDLAQMCYNKKLHASAARFWSEAVEADPKLADDRRAQHRYNAACSAALVVAGLGKDVPPPDDQAKARLRSQALDWLKLELVAWSKVLESATPQARLVIAQTMQHWQKDPDLRAIRDHAALATLSPAERQQWQALWADVDALIRNAGEPKSW